MTTPANADCEALNRRFGAPERIVFRPSADSGAPIVVLANKYGTCEVDLMGARVRTYRPTGQQPVLFLPRNMKPAEPGGWTHGGIPVCWPWFGRNGEPGSAGHGFARAQVFSVRASEYSEDATEITLALVSSDATRKIWPYEFDLEVKISVSMSLNVTLTAQNTGKQRFWCTEGFHPYFLVRDGAPAKVRGVDGAPVCDARAAKADGAPFTAADFTAKWQGDLTVDTDYDHVFTPKDGEYALFDPGLNRTIVIRARGNRKLVVWRPAPADCGGNMAPDDWKRMVCVEPATLFRDEGYWLEPGAKHELRMAIQSDPNDGSVHTRN